MLISYLWDLNIILRNRLRLAHKIFQQSDLSNISIFSLQLQYKKLLRKNLLLKFKIYLLCYKIKYYNYL